MDRTWIQSKARQKTEYLNGVKEFIRYATDHMKPGTNKILCPCHRCNNYCSRSADAVVEHLYTYGMVISYTRWTSHGEELIDHDYNDDYQDLTSSVNEIDEVNEILNDLHGPTPLYDLQDEDANYDHVDRIGTLCWNRIHLLD
ncbi:hypothetical protein Dsin_026803 [Dipteronia sinensis]|uniref:Transposase-associated domain-containing protein n=1 Tax=Dipteronia sinensis TaxID=43782 RepID=A0AAD9ZZW9_9ROSI|nr:hypothetical protein Dsin_026803 [Dipteronia sinensis]